MSERFRSTLQHRIFATASSLFSKRLGTHFHIPVPESVAAAGPYLRNDLWGEAVLTLGSSLAEWQGRRIDGIVNMGPLECMPTKIAEAQFFHIAEQHKALVLTLPMNGDPLDPQALDNFTFEVHARHNARRRA